MTALTPSVPLTLNQRVVGSNPTSPTNFIRFIRQLHGYRFCAAPVEKPINSYKPPDSVTRTGRHSIGTPVGMDARRSRTSLWRDPYCASLAKMAPTNPLLVRLTVSLLVVGFLSLLGIVGMTDWLGSRAQALFADAIGARDIRAAAVELRNALLAAESSERGYLLTGNEIYLAPYNGARALALTKISSLQAGIKTEREVRQTTLLSSIVSRKFEHTDRVIALKRERRDADAIALVRTNRAKALMDEANVFLSGIISAADDRQIATSTEQSENARMLAWVSLVGAFIVVGVVGTVTYAGFKNTRTIAASQGELDALNSTLEERVKSRTEDLVRERDRAEVLVKEINHRVANSLSLTASMVALQSKATSSEALRAALSETHARIFAIADVHKRLYTSDDARSVALDEYLAGILEQMKTTMHSNGRAVGLHYELEPIRMPTDSSVNLGIVVSEWVTNALKYAYPDCVGEVRVKLRRVAGDRAELVVEDDGVGRNGGEIKGSGLGTKIVTAMAAAINGEILYERRHPGTSARIFFNAG
ncbi:MAG: CHASE3 domain-containing protein, partial [Betaproteobacteria bacterium]